MQASLNAKNEKIRELYENKLEKLLEEKEKLENTPKNTTAMKSLSSAFESGKNILLNPLEPWKEGSLKVKIAIQNLVFRNSLFYSKEKSFGTSSFSLLFQVLGYSNIDKSQLVINIFLLIFISTTISESFHIVGGGI